MSQGVDSSWVGATCPLFPPLLLITPASTNLPPATLSLLPPPLYCIEDLQHGTLLPGFQSSGLRLFSVSGFWTLLVFLAFGSCSSFWLSGSGSLPFRGCICCFVAAYILWYN